MTLKLRSLASALTAVLLAGGCSFTVESGPPAERASRSPAPERLAGEGSDASFRPVEDRFEICVREGALVRVSDARCEDEDRGFAWYYVRFSKRVPAVGAKAAGGSFFEPDGDTYRAEKRGGSGADTALRTGTGAGDDDSSFRNRSGCGSRCGGHTRTGSGRR
ncbi:hypothetical protein [Planobispora rosea]|uniref:hypothetical protein n=1 Tax=Planobispora rosea TaxID=35762 RepID=UPI00083B1B9C|nr:hypothetical protein [Planobispora rosea]